MTILSQRHVPCRMQFDNGPPSCTVFGRVVAGPPTISTALRRVVRKLLASVPGRVETIGGKCPQVNANRIPQAQSEVFGVRSHRVPPFIVEKPISPTHRPNGHPIVTDATIGVWGPPDPFWDIRCQNWDI
jgi:hypothetical protein